MAVYDILPEYNLTDIDIRETLNANGGTVSDVSTFFTPEAKNWMWARFKPVRKSDDFTDMTFYKAEDGNCGLSFPSYNHPTLVTKSMDGGNNGWVYNLPRGKSYNEPFRLGDYRKYNPKAGCMFLDFSVPSKIDQSQNLNVEIVVSQNSDSSINRTYLVPEDLASIKDCYFGAYIEGSNANYIKTAEGTIGNGFGSVFFDVSELSAPTTEYKVYPFLCSSKFTSPITPPTDGVSYYPIPNTNVKTFTVNVEQIGVRIDYCDCTVRLNSNIGDYSFRIVSGTSGVSISECYITIIDSEGVIRKSELLNNGGSIGKVSSDGSFSYSGTITIPSEILYDASGKMLVSCKHGDKPLSFKPYDNNIYFQQPED